MIKLSKADKRSLLVAIAGALVFFGLVKLYEYRGDQSDQKEQAAFETLTSLERDMLKAGGLGVVVPDAGPRRIRSFADFYKYVATVCPSAVRSPTYIPTSQPADHSIPSPNPFPGILPSEEYWIPDSEIHSSEDEILISFHHRWGKLYTASLYSNGRAEWRFVPGE